MMTPESIRRIPLEDTSPDATPDLAFSFARFADGFDDHIRRSIRGYDDLVADCIALSPYFVDDDTTVFDIGCSTGNLLHEIRRANVARCPRATYVGIDIEANFESYWRRRAGDRCTFQLADIRNVVMPRDCSLVTSIFSLQFIPERDRQAIVERIYRALVPGGAVIVAEKTLCASAKLNEMVSGVHYDFKRHNFSEAEIQSKARSLRSLMKLWTEEQLIASLVDAGFVRTNIQALWRNHAFSAVIAVR